MTAWKKIHYADPVNDIKSVAGFSPSRQLVGRNEHGYSFKMAVSEVASFETNFLMGADTSEAERLNVYCSAIGEDNKSKLYRVTSFKNKKYKAK